MLPACLVAGLTLSIKCHSMMKKILSEMLCRFMQKYSKIYGIPNNQTCYSISILRVFVVLAFELETHNMSNQIKLL